MSRRIFKTLSLISGLLLAAMNFLWAWSFWTDPRKDCLSFGGDFHVAVQDGRVSFFNEKDYGPYHGSIIALSSGKESDDRIFSKQRAFGDICGIYYRYFRWADFGAVLWTLSVSLFYPAIIFAVLPAIWLWLRRRRVTRFLGALREMFGPQQAMLSVIRLYWWMGVLAPAAYSIAAAYACLDAGVHAAFSSMESLVAMLFCCLAIAVFGASIHVAHRLATRPEGMLPYARMVGIILATAWFPILTIPGIICVRRVTRHFAGHCESMRAEAGNQSA